MSRPARKSIRRVFRLAAAFGIVGMVVGYGAEAYAIDQAPFEGGVVSDARPGYGAEKPRSGSERAGYGAERQYSGAENRHRRAYYRGDDRTARYRSEGSFVEFRDDAYGDVGYADEDGGVFPGIGGSFVTFGDEDDGGEGIDVAAATDTRVIDVARERLDRRSIGPSGTAVSYSGATKIIRIASGMGVSAPAASEPAPPALEPWSDAWARYCRRAHPGFDPARGTFAGADGAARFCTGD